MFQATVYFNTGFNSINMPDKPSLIESFRHTTYPVMDIVQNMFLTSISIKLTPDAGVPLTGYGSIQDADYLKIECTQYRPQISPVWYSIEAIDMTSPDVARLTIVMNSFLTAGGVDGIEIVSGTTIRRNITAEENTFGVYCEDDPMLIPQQPLIADYGTCYEGYSEAGYCENGMFFADPEPDPDSPVAPSYNYPYKHFVRSSLDLSAAQALEYDTQYISNDAVVPYLKSLSQENLGTPKMALPGPNMYMVQSQGGSYIPDSDLVHYQDDGSKYFLNESGNTINQNIALARSLGIESAITASWKIPSNLFTIMNNIIYSKTRYNLLGREDGIYGYIYDRRANPVKYLRCLYGNTSRYIMISPATGSSSEAKPEELCSDLVATMTRTEIDNATQYYQKGPVIVNFADPRPEGKPYFNFLRLRNKDFISGQTTPTRRVPQTYEGCVEGMPWQSSPILYDSNKGNIKYTEQYEASRAMKDWSSAPETMAMAGSTGISSALGNLASGNLYGAAGSFFNTPSGAYAKYHAALKLDQELNNPSSHVENVMGAAATGNTLAFAEMRRGIERDFENAEYQLNMTIIEPQVAFPQNEGLRDAVGNGVFVYRYRPSDADLDRFDKILAKFGHKITEPLKKSHLTDSAENWNYIQAAGVTVRILKTAGVNSSNHRLINDIQSMFQTGIRIWHVGAPQ